MEPSNQFKQLPMFMRAGELMSLHAGDYGRVMSSGDLSVALDRATRRGTAGGNTNASLLDDIAAQGVKQPVTLMHGRVPSGGEIINGHHRIASAFTVNPDMIVPVTHVEAERGKIPYAHVDWDGNHDPDRLPSPGDY